MRQEKYHVDLVESEVERLEDIVKRRKSGCEVSLRSLILLASNRSGSKKSTDSKIASDYNVNIRKIERLRKHFVLHGLDIALSGLPRLNTDKIKFDGVVEAKLVSLRCSDAPEGYSSWTLSLLATKLVETEIVQSICIESVRVILKKTKLSLGASKNG